MDELARKLPEYNLINDIPGCGKKLTSSDLNSTYDILTKNVDSLGVSEPDIVIEGKDQIRVKLAGVTDIESARKALSKVANISFRDINDKLLMDSSVIKSARLGIDDKIAFLYVGRISQEKDIGVLANS